VPAHVARRPAVAGEPAAAHMLGFGGHFFSKSRRYSTTLGALRRAGSPTLFAGAAATKYRWIPGGPVRTTRP
jgi:hypothetical protein